MEKLFQNHFLLSILSEFPHLWQDPFIDFPDSVERDMDSWLPFSKFFPEITTAVYHTESSS